MTLELRKFQLIELIVAIRDEVTLSKYEELIRKASVEAYESTLKPLTVEQYQQRIKDAEEDVKNGDLIDIEDLQKEMENW